MIAKTLYGLEDALVKELKLLGAIAPEKGVRSVSFKGDKGFMYKANLCLRTALKILKPIHKAIVKNEKDLYNTVYNIAWENYLNANQTFAIDAVTFSKDFTHSKYVALKAKDAIADRFRKVVGKRPNVDVKFPDLQINIHIQHKTCTISLDSSGRSLHQRGYRTDTNKAPINEVLAAGMLLLSGWDGQCDFLDPMCGSGTIPIEAAMIACNIPANINRKEFAFEKWNDFDADLFDKIVESSLNKARDFKYTIKGYDRSFSAVRKARENVKNANLQDYITIVKDDFFETEKTSENKLHIVFNPPYGERLPIDVNYFYSQIGNTLKQNYSNSEAWFITSNLEALKHVGLRPTRRIKLFNGKLESKLVKYDIYKGSKKAKQKSFNV